MTVAERKLRILCLHGYLQNAEVFKNRIGSLRKALKSRAEFVFLDAPYLAQAANEQEVREAGGGEAGRSWWEWRDVEPGTRPSRAAQYSGWEASQAAIAAALEEHHPIDGLLGFSQGATAAALFLSYTPPQPQLQPHPCAPHPAPLPLRLAVLIGGFLPKDPSYASAISAARPAVPALMVSGRGDTLVPEERSQALAEAFSEEAVEWYRHPGGHMVPTCSGEFKQALVTFLDGFSAR